MLIDYDAHDAIDHIMAPAKLRLLAEGDSWMSAGGWLNGSLLSALHDRNPDWLVVSCAAPGDTLEGMSDIADFGAYSWMLRQGDGVPPWDALLLSGGGNDLLCGIARLVDRYGVMDERLAATLDGIERAYRLLIRVARQRQPGIPVIVHTYDYPCPQRRAGFFQPGPWVGPALFAAGIDQDRWQEVSNIVIDSLGARIAQIADDLPGVYIVHTAGTLTPDRPGWRRDWANEIHPGAAGYRKLVTLWEKVIDRAVGAKHLRGFA